MTVKRDKMFEIPGTTNMRLWVHTIQDMSDINTKLLEMGRKPRPERILPKCHRCNETSTHIINLVHGDGFPMGDSVYSCADCI